MSRSGVEQARIPGGSAPACWPLGPLVSCDVYHAVGHPQRFARPSSWDPTSLVSSSFILSFCKMWVRISLFMLGLLEYHKLTPGVLFPRSACSVLQARRGEHHAGSRVLFLAP